MNPLWFTLGVPVLSSLLSALLAVNLALKRFYKEKWWERQLEAYISALEALHDIRFVYVEWIEQIIEDKTVDEKVRDELKTKWRAAEAEIRRLIDVGEFLISPSAVRALRAFLRNMHRRSGRDMVDDMEEACDYADEALKQIIAVAKIELKLHPRFASGA